MPEESPRPLLCFKVWTDKPGRQHRAFFWCSIYRNKTLMRKRLSDLRPNMDFSDTMGACLSWTLLDVSKTKAELKPEMGDIILTIGYTGPSTVSHECAHAAHRVVERFIEYKLEDNVTAEERHCITVGIMVRGIFRHLIRYDKTKAKK